jgi:O-antigen ligase
LGSCNEIGLLPCTLAVVVVPQTLAGGGKAQNTTPEPSLESSESKGEMTTAGFSYAPQRLFTSRSMPILAASAALAGSFALGGGTKPGFLTDVILQLLSVPLLFIVLARWRPLQSPGTSSRSTTAALVIVAGLVLIHIAQLVPLPREIWLRLPNRQPILQSFDIIGRSLPWMPASVAPDVTWLALLSLLPAITVFLATLQLKYEERRLMVMLVLCLGGVCALLGLLQVAQGENSPLRPFAFTNPSEAVGLFANRNHFAAQMYSCLVLTAAFAIVATDGWRNPVNKKAPANSSLIGIVACVTLITLFVVTLGMARSRAGFALLVPAMLGAVLLPLALKKGSEARRGSSMMPLLAGFVLTLLMSTQFFLMRMLERLNTSTTTGDRLFAYAKETIEAAMTYMPIGSGVGTFVPVFAMHEKAERVNAAYVNRAHNDFLESWLEMGVPGLLVISAFLIWLMFRMSNVWSGRQPGAAWADLLLARASTIVILLLIVHSLVDYPLRTAAISGLFAFLCAMLLPPGQIDPESETGSTGTPPASPPREKHRTSTSRSSQPSNAAFAADATMWTPGAKPASMTLTPELPQWPQPTQGHPSTSSHPSIAHNPMPPLHDPAAGSPVNPPPPPPTVAPASATKLRGWDDAAAWPKEWQNPEAPGPKK